MDDIDRLIISESSDCELDLYQIIYDIHFYRPELTITEKYKTALSSLFKLEASQYIEIIEQFYERTDSMVNVSSERIIASSELDQILKHPKVWDRAQNFAAESALIVTATQKGIGAIET
ncbi:hypothetical protein I6F65_21340 [Pseudoalteromonas sp. SWXJZ94C]|uniref:hypothetical protein n=1 Tax=unclassified Pseudoalteromonas TaxID=194690 RepID=UPI00140D029E|nr:MULTISPECIES: hypothetical protein [unclassified Pseudoalteromonas]MBH0059479.1 hypothetical protein [Pseudoalteromonas sp. SWXJZ94C]